MKNTNEINVPFNKQQNAFVVKKTKTVQTLNTSMPSNKIVPYSNRLSRTDEIVARTSNGASSWKDMVLNISDRLAHFEEKFTNIAQMLENNIANQVKQKKEAINFDSYLKEVVKKIDTLAKKVIKIEQKVESNELNIKKIKDLPEVKKELKIQQKILKNMVKGDYDE